MLEEPVVIGYCAESCDLIGSTRDLEALVRATDVTEIQRYCSLWLGLLEFSSVEPPYLISILMGKEKLRSCIPAVHM